MAAVARTNSLSLDRGASLHYQNKELRTPFGTLPTNINLQNIREAYSDIEKVKQTIIDSRRSFLKLDNIDLSSCKEKLEDQGVDRKQNVSEKKKTHRKVSFKCKKTSNVYWKPKSGSTDVNVAQLTSKFNQMSSGGETIAEECTILAEEIRLKQTANKVDHVSIRRVHRKPSVKTKPKIDDPHRPSTVPRSKNSAKKRSEFKKAQTEENETENQNIFENVTNLRMISDDLNEVELRRCSFPVDFASRDSKKHEFPSSVRAAIELFEKGSTNYLSVNDQKSTTCVPKPKVPEKTVRNRTKELVIKDGVLMWKIVKSKERDSENKEDSLNSLTDNPCNEENTNKFNFLEKSDNEESIIIEIPKRTDEKVNVQTEIQLKEISYPDEEESLQQSEEQLSIPVQIINIPLTPPKRCDSVYETKNIKRASPRSSSQEALAQPNNSFLWRIQSRENLKKLQKKGIDDNVSVTSSMDSLKTDPSISSLEQLHHRVDNPYAPLSATSDLSNSVETLDGYEIPQIKINEEEDLYDFVDTSAMQHVKGEKLQPPEVPPRPSSFHLIANRTSPSAQKQTNGENDHSPRIEMVRLLGDDDHTKNIHKYEELDRGSDDGYEYCRSPTKSIYEKIPVRMKPASEDDYEYCSQTNKNVEGIYEVIPPPPPLLPRNQNQPLPPRPPSVSLKQEETTYNCYESIYNTKSYNENDYEMIRSGNKWDLPSNRHSLLSCDQQSNSIYERSGSLSEEGFHYSGKANSDLSISDKSDEWIDISDNEGSVSGNTGLVIVREKQKGKKTGWPQKIRDQRNKRRNGNSDGESDADHHYESLSERKIESPQIIEDYDSFESDNESEYNTAKNDKNFRNISIAETRLPEPPSSQQYKFTKFAASAGKKMKKLKRNFTHHKNDITRSITWMTRRFSSNEVEVSDEKIRIEKAESSPKINSLQENELSKSLYNVVQEVKLRNPELQVGPQYQNVDFLTTEYTTQGNENDKSKNGLNRRSKFLDKFRRSMTLSADSANELTQQLNKPRSTFYLTSEIDLDNNSEADTGVKSKSNSVSSDSIASPKNNEQNNRVSVTIRPKCPPPPIPTDANQNIDRRSSNKSTSTWYSEYSLFKNIESSNNRSPSTSWYAEIGLYQTSGSTPSTSSTENSGNNSNVNVRNNESESINQQLNEHYFNLKNQKESNYYNESIDSFSSTDTKTESNFDVSHTDIQLHLEDEPLYQFYDAAILEDVCKDATSDFDYDGYEEVGEKQSYENYSNSRPTAMQIIAPNRNGVTVARTLWCEIPEVVQSTVLSTLSTHQKKLQEAKFEMMTSEASYLNSLNVLNDHFIMHLNNSEYLTKNEKDILFEKIPAVKKCSEKLLLDLEKCWQDNILLHGICEIIQKHAEENFYVYVSYCENQILLDCILKQIKERPNCSELLKHLESSHACQSLTLYSFLMLPMQRITRWPLLLDAVLKRLSPQDSEFLPCQHALATINKIVTQCNEGARKMERITEMKKIENQLEFPKGLTPFRIASENRWLIRSGSVTQMQTRNDDSKLTFGKRFLKSPLYLFLFNDILIVTKSKGDDIYTVVHYCMRSYVELNVNEMVPIMPTKDIQGRNLLFLTLLENHDGKTVEMLLSCNSESDKERWIEALSQPKSEDPNETLYECWDCPQVTVIHTYVANQPDELTLSRGDVLNVTRKMADGWYHGERIRDGETGWFPSNYTVEVANPHVRARNLKQRYRLLALSENYLKSK